MMTALLKNINTAYDEHNDYMKTNKISVISIGLDNPTSQFIKSLSSVASRKNNLHIEQIYFDSEHMLSSIEQNSQSNLILIDFDNQKVRRAWYSLNALRNDSDLVVGLTSDPEQARSNEDPPILLKPLDAKIFLGFINRCVAS